jgi:hypothetical protein
VFEPTSRYAGIETAELAVDERRITYVRRRFVPPPATGTEPVSHAVLQGERLDHLAARYFGDPTQFWRICDANGVLRPGELTAVPGRAIDIPLPAGL